MPQTSDPFQFILTYKKDLIEQVENDLAGKVPVVYDKPDGTRDIRYEKRKDGSPVMTQEGIDIIKSFLDQRITKFAAMSKLERRDCLNNAIDITEALNTAITLDCEKYLYYDKATKENYDEKMLQWIAEEQVICGMLFDFFMLAEKGSLKEWAEKILKQTVTEDSQGRVRPAGLGNAVGAMLTRPPQGGGA